MLAPKTLDAYFASLLSNQQIILTMKLCAISHSKPCRLASRKFRLHLASLAYVFLGLLHALHQ